MQVSGYDIRKYDEFPTIGRDEVDAQPFRDREPVELSVSDFPAWPRKTFEMRFDYNSADKRWYWGVDLSGGTTIVPYQPIGYAKLSQFRGYILFQFVDFSQTSESVTPETIFQSVELVGIPGPVSPGFDDWAERQVLASDIEQEVLE